MNLRGRNFLTLLDYSKEEIEELLDLAAELKNEKRHNIEQKFLEGKNIVVLFEKDSTRTRCAFEVAAYDQGMNVTYLGPSGSQMGKKETIKDTARVLGRMYDGIEYRGFAQETVEILGEYSGVPVWNGLTDLYHPTQILADLLTIKERFGHLKGIKFSYLGDARYNMGNSLMIGSAIMGLDFTVVAPKKYWPSEDLIMKCEELSAQSGAKLSFTEDVVEGTKDRQVVYTDVWVSMGEAEEVWESRIKELMPYQINMEVLKNCSDDVIFMHCLPAFHNVDTKIGKEIFDKYGITEMEVTDEVFEHECSVVFDEAENRLHTIKAVMVATLRK